MTGAETKQIVAEIPVGARQPRRLRVVGASRRPREKRAVARRVRAEALAELRRLLMLALVYPLILPGRVSLRVAGQFPDNDADADIDNAGDRRANEVVKDGIDS